MHAGFPSRAIFGSAEGAIGGKVDGTSKRVPGLPDRRDEAMKRRTWMQGVLTGVLLAGAAAGCHKPAVREKPVPDPLLTSKKPIAGRTIGTDNHWAAGEELPPPPPPGSDFPPSRGDAVIVRMLGPRAPEQ
jgi:hypothetical protein